MFVSAREKLIVEILLEKNEAITIKALAEEIDVSPRTIHRDLKGIEVLLKQYELTLIRKASIGIQIAGSTENKQQLKRKLMTVALQEYLADERQTMILCTLYEAAGPVKLFALANELRVTESTISADLLKLENQLEHFELSILKKRGHGIELSGTEKAKRRAISYVIAKTLKEDEFLSLIRKNRQQQRAIQENSISERLLHLVDREKLLVIEDVLRELKDETLISITDHGYVGLIVHLALAIERMTQGEKIIMDNEFLTQLKREPEFSIAEKIIKALQLRFKIDIPIAEIGYITMHLQGAKQRQYEENLLEGSSLYVVMQTKKLIQLIEEATGNHLMKNAQLLEGLVTHLRPALYRIEQNMGITNPLLPNIRKDYGDLFQIVEEACHVVFEEIDIPSEEIGYLVMHFGATILGQKGRNDLKAYVVCSSGIGTSKMLATRLRREIREIEEIHNVSVFELHELQLSARDLIISTIHLQGFTEEYICVSPFLTTDEIHQIQQYARRKLLVKKESSVQIEQDSPIEAIIARMSRLDHYTRTVAQLLTGFEQSIATEVSSLDDAVQMMCKNLATNDVIENPNLVADAVMARQALSGTGIPSTKMALLHTRHEAILKPSFTIHSLKQTMTIEAMDQTEIEVSHLLLLLAPKNYDVEGLEVLSLVSTLIIEDAQSIALFESGNEKRIHAYIGMKLERFIDEKYKK